MVAHSDRKHSKYSASGAERWFNCQGSVALSEGLPDKSSSYAEEGTYAHELLEKQLKLILKRLSKEEAAAFLEEFRRAPSEMQRHVISAAQFIIKISERHPGAETLVETRVTLPPPYNEAFGTFDGAVVDYFGTLHVFDFKYGAGVFVPVEKNLQMLFYGIGLAFRYQWNFKRIRLWIIQPRVRGYDGPIFWEISLNELLDYRALFEYAIDYVRENPDKYVEGSWCHWCKAKSVCPLKREAKREKAKSVFTNTPLDTI